MQAYQKAKAMGTGVSASRGEAFAEDGLQHRRGKKRPRPASL